MTVDADKALKNARKRIKLEAVMDGFSNAVANIGDKNRKLAAGKYEDEPILDVATLETLFKDNDLAYKIVTKPVEDAWRCGFGLKRKDSSPEEDADDADLIKEEFNRLVFVGEEDSELEGAEEDKFQRAANWGRLFGGGGLILGVRGAGALASPLRADRVTAVEFLVDFDRQDMTALTWYPDGRVETYQWSRPGNGSAKARTAVVHESRIIKFPGAYTTNRMRIRNQTWDLSVLQRVYKVLKSFDACYASVDAMFADASQAIFKLQGLIAALAEADSNTPQDVATRIQVMDMLRSSSNAIVLEAGSKDGEGAEDFGVVERKFSGIPEMIEKYLIRLACAAGMPLTVLLGMSPAGMDATGESDLIIYYNSVDVYRKKVLEPRLLKLVRLIHTALGLEGDPKEWQIEWPELQRPSPMDVATAEKMRVDMLVALITSQAIVPEEAAMAIPGALPSLGLVLDMESREKALKEAMTEAKNREMTGPTKPEPVLPGASKAPAAKATKRKTPAKAAGRQT